MPHGYQVRTDCSILPFPSVFTHENTDFVGVDKMTFQFELGRPFRPFEQLMGVLPEGSKELIPPPYRVSVKYFFWRGGVLFFSVASYVRC